MELAIVSIVLSIAIPLVGYFLFIDRRLTKVETMIGPFWKMVEDKLPEILHSPDPAHKQMDDLLEKFMKKDITDEELCDLHQLMAAKINSVNPGRQVQYMLLMARIEQIIKERDAGQISWKKRVGFS